VHLHAGPLERQRAAANEQPALATGSFAAAAIVAAAAFIQRQRARYGRERGARRVLAGKPRAQLRAAYVDDQRADLVCGF
jgi:hypothetical protein